MSVGVVVDTDYATSYQIDISWLDLWLDTDRDGLSDADEANLRTSPTSHDTDGDGTGDWDDLRPLDPGVGAVHLDLWS